MSENGCRVFPIITNAVQKEYEKCSMNTKSSDRTPEIWPRLRADGQGRRRQSDAL